MTNWPEAKRKRIGVTHEGCPVYDIGLRNYAMTEEGEILGMDIEPAVTGDTVSFFDGENDLVLLEDFQYTGSCGNYTVDCFADLADIYVDGIHIDAVEDRVEGVAYRTWADLMFPPGEDDDSEWIREEPYRAALDLAAMQLYNGGIVEVYDEEEGVVINSLESLCRADKDVGIACCACGGLLAVAAYAFEYGDDPVLKAVAFESYGTHDGDVAEKRIMAVLRFEFESTIDESCSINLQALDLEESSRRIEALMRCEREELNLSFVAKHIGVDAKSLARSKGALYISAHRGKLVEAHYRESAVLPKDPSFLYHKMKPGPKLGQEK